MTRREALVLALVLLLALAFRLVAHAGFDAHTRTFAPLVDSEAYLFQALRVADGEPLVEGVTFQAPLYPWVLGWALRLAGVQGAGGAEQRADVPDALWRRAVNVGQVLNHLFGLALVLLLWRVGRALFSPAAGLWAAALAAVSSPLVFYEGHLLKVSLSVLVLPLAVLAAHRALTATAARAPRAPRAWILVGLTLGLGGLVRGNMYLLVWGGASLLILGGWRTRRWRPALACAAWLALGAALAVAPVVLRNSLVAGRPVLATAAGGTAFFLCNHAGNDTGLIEFTSLNRQVPRHEEGDWHDAAERGLERALTPAEVSHYWMGEALGDIRADPLRWLRLEARKLGLLFSRYEAPDNTLVALGELELPLLARTPSRWLVVLPLALAGAVLAWTRRRRGQGLSGRTALALAAGGYAASLLLFNMTSRFRMPVEPLAMVWAGHALASLPSLTISPLRARLGLAAALLAGLALGRASEGPLGPLDQQELASHLSVRYLNRALLARDQGDLDAARADLDAAAQVALAAELAVPALLVERAAIDRADAFAADASGDLPAAAAARELAQRRVAEALRLSPDHGPAWRLTGMLAYDLGRAAEAVPAYERALQAVPRDREARQYLCLSLLQLARWDEAAAHAGLLCEASPQDEVGFGLAALALAGGGQTAAARSALESYDRLASMREAAGLTRRLPEQPLFSQLRQAP